MHLLNQKSGLLFMFRIPPGYLLLVLSLTSVCISCNKNGNGQTEGEILISGSVVTEQPVFLILEELTPTEILPLDTFFTEKNGSFTFRLHISHSGFYRLGTTTTDFITLAVEPGERIEFSGVPGKLRETYNVSGSAGSEILWRLNQNVMKGQLLADSLRNIYRQIKTQPGFETKRAELKEQYKEIITQQREFTLELIDENQNSLASILALFQYFEDNLILNENEHFQWFEKLSKSLCPLYPSNKHVISLKKKVHEINRRKQQESANEQNITPGNRVPDITLPDEKGNPLALSSLSGNLILIDFWASWCPPCRENNKKIARLFDRYNDAGFEVYSISLDRNRNQWLSAIKQENLSWKHVSDTRFMNSPVVSLFMVEEIPHYVLVDRNMNIIARDFSISELEALVRENL